MLTSPQIYNKMSKSLSSLPNVSQMALSIYQAAWNAHLIRMPTTPREKPSNPWSSQRAPHFTQRLQLDKITWAQQWWDSLTTSYLILISEWIWTEFCGEKTLAQPSWSVTSPTSTPKICSSSASTEVIRADLTSFTCPWTWTMVAISDTHLSIS